MSLYLTQQHKQQLLQWKGWHKDTSFTPLFRASEKGHTQAAFHTACDNKGPTVVLICLASGEIFGGFTSVSWDSSNTQAIDTNAFLFKLWGIPEIFNVVAGGADAINRNATLGPTFGTTELAVFENTPTKGCSSTLGAAFPFVAQPGSTATAATALSGRAAPWGALDVEVLQVLPPAGGIAPSRSVVIDWDHVENLRRVARAWAPTFVDAVQVECPNILIVGGLGTGKSATINTIITALSETDGIRRIATSRSDEKSVTTKLGGYDLRMLGKSGQPLANFNLLDSAGWTPKNYNKIVEPLLDGRIPHNNTVNIGDSDNQKIDDKLLIRSAVYAHSVHCVVFVFPYDKTQDVKGKDIDNYFSLIEAAHDEVVSRGINYLALITFCDEDPTIQASGLRAAYDSPSLTAARSRVAGKLKLSRGEVLLLKNYNDEAQPSREVDALALFVVRNIQQSVDNAMDRFALGFGSATVPPSSFPIQRQQQQQQQQQRQQQE